MPIDLIDQIIPKNASFTGLVDAKQVIGGVGNVLPDATQPALTGDVTSPAGSTATTLANSGVAAGTYNKDTSWTVDAKGRITAINGNTPGPNRIGMSINPNSGTYQNQWTKVATARITARYGDTDMTTLIMASGSGNSVTTRAVVEWGLKQQNLMGDAPAYDIKIRDMANFVPGDIKMLIMVNSPTETVAELWARCRTTYDTLNYYDLASYTQSSGSTVTYEQNGGWQAALPTPLYTAVERTPGETYVQETMPTMTTPGVWIELNPNGTVKTMWAGTNP